MPSKGPREPLEARLLDLPQPEARALLESGAPAYLLVNPIEYHGPHLSLRNDGLLAHGMSRALHGALHRGRPEVPFLLGGVIDAGVDTVRGPGSQPMRMAVVASLPAGPRERFQQAIALPVLEGR